MKKKGAEQTFMKILIIIPAYNEEANIERVVENLRVSYPQYDYIVVNDGSKDCTAELCCSHGYPLLDVPINLGLSGAFQTGMRYAQQRGYDAVLQFDGDGQHEPQYIDKMVKMIEENGCDIVIGSRFFAKKKPFTLRMMGSRFISLAIWLTTRKRVTDPTSGMRLFGPHVLQKFSENINYGPEPDTISYLLYNGAHIAEVQVEMHERIAGESYLDLGRSLRYMLNMFVSILFIQFFRLR